MQTLPLIVLLLAKCTAFAMAAKPSIISRIRKLQVAAPPLRSLSVASFSTYVKFSCQFQRLHPRSTDTSMLRLERLELTTFGTTMAGRFLLNFLVPAPYNLEPKRFVQGTAATLKCTVLETL